MKNISLLVDGVNVAFDQDGTMRYIAMKVVNMDEEHRWQEVSFLVFTILSQSVLLFPMIGVL